jgi:hypothetical protein
MKHCTLSLVVLLAVCGCITFSAKDSEEPEWEHVPTKEARKLLRSHMEQKGWEFVRLSDLEGEWKTESRKVALVMSLVELRAGQNDHILIQKVNREFSINLDEIPLDGLENYIVEKKDDLREFLQKWLLLHIPSCKEKVDKIVVEVESRNPEERKRQWKTRVENKCYRLLVIEVEKPENVSFGRFGDSPFLVIARHADPRGHRSSQLQRVDVLVDPLGQRIVITSVGISERFVN